MIATSLSYFYRDGANFKYGEGIYIAGPPTDELIRPIKTACTMDGLFIPDQVGLPMAAPWTRNWQELHDDLDDVWHELGDFEKVRNISPQQVRGPRKEIVEKFREADREGWNHQEPMEWYGSRHRQVMFEELVEAARPELIHRLLQVHQTPNLAARAARAWFRRCRETETFYDGARLLELAPELTASLPAEKIMWLLQAPDPRIRQRVIRATSLPTSESPGRPAPQEPRIR